MTPKKLCYLALFVVLYFLGMVSISFSQEESDRIELTGERLIYHPEKEEATVEKGTIQHGEYTIEADFIKILLKDKKLFAQGHVRVRTEDEGYHAREIAYNWAEDQWMLYGVRSDLRGEGIEGTVYFRGEEVERTPEETKIEGAFFTSCDLEEPHYHFEAQKIIIYPDKKVELFRFSYWDFGRKLFTLPYYVIFLDRKEQLPFLPLLGHSSSSGYYLNLFYNYFVSDGSFGTVYLDWWEKSGWGLGVRHFIEHEKPKETLEGYLYYRDKPEGSRDYLKGSLNYYQEPNPDASLTLGLDYLNYQGSNQDTFSGTFSFAQKKEDYSMKLNLDYDWNLASEEDQLRAVLNTSYQLEKNLNANLELDYSQDHQWGEFTDQELDYELALSHSQDPYSYKLTYTGFLDLDQDLYTGDFGNRVLKEPELSISRKKEQIGQSDFYYQPSLTIGSYFEQTTGVKEERIRLSLKTTGKSELGENTTLEPVILFTQDFYGNGFARYTYDVETNLKQSFGEHTTLSLGYGFGGYDGATPFRFDYTTRKTSFLDLNLHFAKDPWEVSFSSGYDFLEKQFLDGIINVSYTKDSNHSVELRANYDFENSEWEGLVFEISWPLGKEWALDCQGNYDFSSHKIESIRVGLTRDLHCREVTLFYDQSKDTFWIEYAIKAFPEYKFSLGGE
ncbi:hypothetical protein [Atrimonas thermophila]|uniref:hypothetical protein n=1 Tax=Atrimonas thermophila TaxID=3064161 RepID=UPI00399D1255